MAHSQCRVKLLKALRHNLIFFSKMTWKKLILYFDVIQFFILEDHILPFNVLNWPKFLAGPDWCIFLVCLCLIRHCPPGIYMYTIETRIYTCRPNINKLICNNCKLQSKTRCPLFVVAQTPIPVIDVGLQYMPGNQFNSLQAMQLYAP